MICLIAASTILLSQADARTVDLEEKGPKIVCDEPFRVQWENEWDRPWTLKVSFDYRTVGTGEKAVAVKLRGIKDDGEPAILPLWPDTVTGERDDIYLLTASDDFRSVAVDVQLPNVIRPKYRFEWFRRFDRKGKVEVRNFKVELVSRPLHRIDGGLYPIRPAKEKHFNLRSIFFGDSGAVDVSFAFPERRPRCGVAVRDVKGRTLKKIAGRDGRAHVDFPTRGFWDIEAVAVYPDGARIATTASVAVVGRPIPHDMIRKSRYGVMTVHGRNELAELLGSHWDQKFLMIDQEHRTLDMPNDTADVIFNFNRGLVPPHLLAEKDRGRSGCFPPADWDAYRKFCGEWFDAHPLALERKIGLTGELDFQWRGTDEEYVKMCRIFTEEGRRRNPNFFALGPTCSRIRMPYLKRMRKEGLFDFLSAVAIHHYVDGTKPEGEYLDDFRDMFDYFRSEGINLPVYVTETGWTVGAGRYFVPVTRENQARYLTRAMALMSTMRIDGIVWFVDFTMLNEFGYIYQTNEAAHPKPMICAFAGVTRNLSDVEGDMSLRRLDEKTFLVSGRKPGGRWVHVWWRSSGEAAVKPPVAATTAEDYLGTPVATGAEMTVSEDPLYLFSGADYDGPVWTPPPGGECAAAPKVSLKPDIVAGTYAAGGQKTAQDAPPVPAALWSDPENAPAMRIACGREGFAIEADVRDTKHCQPFTRERVVEGDSLVVAFDVDKCEEWQANEVFMRYKGHRCVEYSISLKDGAVKAEVFRRNCWIPDMGRFEPVGNNIRASVRRDRDGVTKYWAWIPWANLGLDEQLKPGALVGFAAALYSSDGGKVSVNRLFDGIVPPLNPMKYGVLELK